MRGHKDRQVNKEKTMLKLDVIHQAIVLYCVIENVNVNVGGDGRRVSEEGYHGVM